MVEVQITIFVDHSIVVLGHILQYLSWCLVYAFGFTDIHEVRHQARYCEYNNYK